MGEPADFGSLSVADLRRATAIYLGIAYPDGVPPPAVGRRLDWPDRAPADLVSGPPFERVSTSAGSASGSGAPIYALRLGNARYPHMKLQVQPWPNPVGYMLSVNTHDQVLALDPADPGADAFRVLQAENGRLKEAIEAAWDREGLPTFARYLRDYIEAQPTG